VFANLERMSCMLLADMGWKEDVDSTGMYLLMRDGED
jgi:hypothetical protein